MQCNEWPSGKRCKNQAVAWLQCNGKDTPGCYVCAEHAKVILTEYARFPETGKWNARELTTIEKM